MKKTLSNDIKIIICVVEVIILIALCTVIAVVKLKYSGGFSGLNNGNSVFGVSSEKIAEPTEQDFKMFEEMLDKTDHIWYTDKRVDFDSLPLDELVNCYISTFGGELMYSYFWGDDISKAYDEEMDNKGYYGIWYEFNADKADWIIENIFCNTPDRTFKTDFFHYENDKMRVFYGDGGDAPTTYKIAEKCKLDDNKYGFRVECYYAQEDFPNAYYYYIASLQNDKEIGNYWRIHTYSNRICYESNGETDILSAYLNEIEKASDAVVEQAGDDYISISSNPRYTLYDIDNNGVLELIVRTGICEGDYEYQFYTFDKSIKHLGSCGATHSDMFIPNDKNGVYIANDVHTGMGSLRRVTVEDGKIKSEEIISQGQIDRNKYLANPIEEYHSSDMSKLNELR